LRLGRQRLELSFQVWNLLNNRTLLDFDPASGKRWQPGKGSLNAVRQNPDYLPLADDELVRVSGETPRPGQTVGDLAESIRNSIRSTIARYENPAMRSAPRTFRAGVTVEW
jgi:hypothetical protein